MALDPASFNPVDVERELLRYVALLEKATQETRRRGIASAEADSAFRTAYAKAMVSVSDGPKQTVSEREAAAALLTESEFRAKREAEELLHAARSASSNLREMLGALRTISSNLRALVQEAR